jgi:hypothetical protein
VAGDLSGEVSSNIIIGTPLGPLDDDEDDDAPGEVKNPAILIRSFGRGLILSAMGALCGIGFLVLRPYYLAVIGSMLFMVGSILIVQALLRGEEIDQKNLPIQPL